MCCHSRARANIPMVYRKTAGPLYPRGDTFQGLAVDTETVESSKPYIQVLYISIVKV